MNETRLASRWLGEYLLGSYVYEPTYQRRRRQITHHLMQHSFLEHGRGLGERDLSLNRSPHECAVPVLSAASANNHG